MKKTYLKIFFVLFVVILITQCSGGSGDSVSTSTSSSTANLSYCDPDTKDTITVYEYDMSTYTSVSLTNADVITANTTSNKVYGFTIPNNVQYITKVTFPAGEASDSETLTTRIQDPVFEKISSSSFTTVPSDGSLYYNTSTDLSAASNGETVAYFFCPNDSTVICYPACYSAAVYFNIVTE